MTEGEKGVLSLFVIGVMIVVGKVLAGGEPITPRLFIGRMLLGGFVSMVAGVVLVQFPDMSLPAVLMAQPQQPEHGQHQQRYQDFHAITPPAVRHTVTSLSRLCSRWP